MTINVSNKTNVTQIADISTTSEDDLRISRSTEVLQDILAELKIIVLHQCEITDQEFNYEDIENEER